MTVFDIMIIACCKEADALCVKLNDQKKIEIMSLHKTEGLKRAEEVFLMPPAEVEGRKTWYSNGRPKSVQNPSVTNATAAEPSKKMFIQSMQPTNVGKLFNGLADTRVISQPVAVPMGSLFSGQADAIVIL